MSLPNSLNEKPLKSLGALSSLAGQPVTPGSSVADLCPICQSVDLNAHLQCQELRWVANGAIVHLDHVPKNPSLARCSLCRFLSRCVEAEFAKTPAKRNEPEGPLFPDVLKGFVLTFSYHGHTRTLEGEQTQSFVAKIQNGSSSVYALPLGADAFRLANCQQSYARPLHPVQADRNLILCWLNECRSRHLSCSKYDREFHVPIDLPGLRLIDVHTSCVVQATDETQQYLTLSYVWGAIDQLVLNVATFDQLCTPGAFETSFQTRLPQVILDAMQITQELGFRYLWVDTLCICQDDIEEQTAQIAAMNLIYKGATMTLVAAEADNAFSGLPGVRPYPQPREAITERVGLLRLSTVSPPVDELLTGSKWMSRAWTFGEDQFSRRLLYFTKQQVYFRCLLYAHREDNFEEDPGVYTGKGQRILHDFVNQEYGWLQSCLAEFSQRIYTFPNDRLDAFKGILTEMTERAGYQFLDGIPIKDFLPALRWKHDILTSRRNVLYPSWSWAGWDGAISLPDRDPDCGLFTSGCLPRIATFRAHTPRGPLVWKTPVVVEEAVIQKSVDIPQELSKQHYSKASVHKLYVRYSSLEFDKITPESSFAQVSGIFAPESSGDHWKGSTDTTSISHFSGSPSEATMQGCELHDQLQARGSREYSTSSPAPFEIKTSPNQYSVTRLSFVAFSIHIPIFLSFSESDRCYIGRPAHLERNQDNPNIKLYFDTYTPDLGAAPTVAINMELLLLSTDISNFYRTANKIWEESKDNKITSVVHRLTTATRSALRDVSPTRLGSPGRGLGILSAGYRSVAKLIESACLPSTMMVVAHTMEFGVYERIGIAEWDEHAFERYDPQAKQYILA